MKVIGNAVTAGLSDLMKQLQAEASGEIKAVPTPWATVNRLIGGGFWPGEICITAAPPGNGKSFMALACCVEAERMGFAWQYLPFEDRHEKWTRRCLAMVAGDWCILKRDDPDCSRLALEAAATHAERMANISRRILQNPRTPLTLTTGKRYAPPVPWREVAEWVGDAAQDLRLLVLDPISMIDFEPTTRTGTEASEQAAFFRELVAAVHGTGCAILAVHHVVKRPGRAAGIPLGLDDLGGSWAFAKAAHMALLLDAHEERTSDIFIHGIRTPKAHKRTLFIAKTRDGDGAGIRLACDFDSCAPRLEVHGPIAPKER